jgi:hypothetical protein
LGSAVDAGAVCVCRFVDVAFARKMLPDLSQSQTIDFRATVKNTHKWEYICSKKNTEMIEENAPSVVNCSLFAVKKKKLQSDLNIM